MTTSSAPGGEHRLALAAGISCYVFWGLVPLMFQAMARLGADPWEIMAQRTMWGAVAALGFVLLARQGREALAILRQPKTVAWLALSAAFVAGNWSVFIWAVNSGRVLETSLGYYILPLMNMAAGALLFGERLDPLGKAAIALAAVGVALQTAALGHLPLVSLVLAVTFGGYGVVRKRVAAEAQTGLLVECALLAIPGAAYVFWLQSTGHGHFGQNLPVTAWLIASGPLTAVPLVLFTYSTRRIALSAVAFMQFITPTMTFFLGVSQGEPFSLLRGISFGLIWAGVAVFGYAAWRSSRSAMKAAIESAAEESQRAA